MLLEQHPVAPGLLDGVEVLALEVFDQGQLHGLAVVGLDHEHGDFIQSRQPRGAPAALTGDDLIVFPRQLPHRQRLQDAVGRDGIGQGLQGLVVEARAGLLRVGLHPLDGDLLHAGAGRGRLKVTQQGAESFAQSFRHV